MSGEKLFCAPHNPGLLFDGYRFQAAGEIRAGFDLDESHRLAPLGNQVDLPSPTAPFTTIALIQHRPAGQPESQAA